MADNNNNQNFKCSGNCLNCSPAQRAYCSSQHSYSNMKVLDSLMSVVLSMQEDLISMGEKIEAIQNNEASVFDPNNIEPKSAERDAAQIIGSPNSLT